MNKLIVKDIINSPLVVSTEKGEMVFQAIDNHLRKNESVIIDFKGIDLMITAFLNAAIVVLRYEFSIWKEKKTKMGADYKRDFVGTEIYQEKVRSVKEQLNAILNLPNIIRLPDNFNAISLDNVFSDFGASDFNDAYINETVNSKNLILVTDDGDFEAIYKGKKLVTMS